VRWSLLSRDRSFTEAAKPPHTFSRSKVDSQELFPYNEHRVTNKYPKIIQVKGVQVYEHNEYDNDCSSR
jgi:hypothetical protein